MYTFIIDTDSYSGNFERSLAEWVTGQPSFSGVRSEEGFAAEIPPELLEWFEDCVIVHPDSEYQDYCAIEPRPGWRNTGLGVCYPATLSDEEALALVKKTGVEYYEREVQRLGESAPAFVAESNRRKKEELLSLTKAIPYPAFLSVGIHLAEKPSEETLSFMKERALSFGAAHVPEIKIAGFRGRTTVTTATEEEP